MCSRRRSKLGHSVWRRFGVSAVFLVFGVLAGVPALSRAADSCDSPLSCCDQGSNCREFYLSGIVGADFATLDKLSTGSTIPNQSIFTAGGAAGVRFLRENGAMRLEFEGRGRDQVSETFPGGLTDLTYRATDGWSAMVNVWRDYKPFESLGLYAGGGIGAGGYRWTLSSDQPPLGIGGNDRVANFAWQAGGGVFYEFSKRVTVDLGYRFFSIDESVVGYDFFYQPQTSPTNFTASELLLQVRIYEPFRSWRR
jgi:opacity protein-like surface antigen